ncbi:MAG: hypothetical protein ACJA0Y_000997 [Maricaulis maris]|jgi:hypothetical protein
MTDTTDARTEIENATWEIRERARQNAYVGFWIAASSVLVGVLAYFGIDLFGQGLTDPVEKAFALGFVVIYALIIAGFAVWSWTGSRIGAVVIFCFAVFEIIAVIINALTGAGFALPILPIVLTFFAGRGMLASFKYQSERKRLINEQVFS